ncbi:MAG: cbb3-type cytochrome c oxidase subunit I [Elusimicrobia bacterium]|nr:cbb3-type cytochrome c oxidase subunit I [Elusimicrobiota bacterium]
MIMLSDKKDSASERFLLSAVAWLCLSTSIGAMVALKFLFPEWLGSISWLSFGRLRPVHTNGVLFGWLSMAYVGAMFYILPRLLGTELWSQRLGNLTCWLWNATILLGALTLALGLNQGVEYAELIWPLDLAVAGLFVLVNWNLWATFLARSVDRLYISIWYMFASLLWTPLVYAIGNGMLFPVTYTGGLASIATPYSGVNHAAVNWFYGHNVIGLWFTTVGVGIVYYLLPKISGKPIHSHRLGMIGFWTIAFVYVWTGQHHLLYGPGPDWLETVSIVFSISLLIPVWTVVYNFWRTLEGRWSLFFEQPSAKFLILGVWWYFLTCLQGPLTNAIRPISKVLHFTNWVVGHAHLALLGAFTYICFSAIYYLWPRLTGREVGAAAAKRHFWLTTLGLIIFMVSLWAGGLVQGTVWSYKTVDVDFATDQAAITGIPFLKSVEMMLPYYWLRLAGGLMIVLAQWDFLAALLRSRRARA